MLATATYPTLLVTLVLSLAACNEEKTAPTPVSVSMFTGQLNTADAVVALAVSPQGNVKAYVCGGDTSFATQSRWFVGSFSSGTASLKTDAFQLDLTQHPDAMDLTLTDPDGAKHSTVVERAPAGNHSALYESPLDSDCRWGVVVMDDGSAEPLVSGTWCQLTPNKIYAQVTPVKPIDFSKTIMPVLVTTPNGEETFDVHLANPDGTSP